MNKLVTVLVLVFGVVCLPSLVGAADAAKVDVTGTWDAVVETAQGSGTPVLVLKQNGNAVSGKYQGQLGEAAISGNVSGNRIVLRFTTPGGDSVKIEYSGTVDGSTMKGTAKFGSEGEGSFTATKRGK